MAELELTKHHGLGNDFLVAFHPHVDDLPALARRVCDRRRGIGADGLLIAETEPGYAARMTLYNADGSMAEMSGNGIRCFAQAVAMRRGDMVAQRILTDAGERIVTLFPTDDPAVIEAAVDMGAVAPITAPVGWNLLGVDPMRPSATSASAIPRRRWCRRRRRGRPAGTRPGRAPGQPGDRRTRSGARMRSRCASTSGAPGSPKPAGRGRAPAPGPRWSGASYGRRQGNHRAHGRRRCQGTSTPTRMRARHTVGPAVYIGSITVQL